MCNLECGCPEELSDPSGRYKKLEETALKKHHNLYSQPNKGDQIREDKIRWVGCMIYVRQKRNSYRVLMGRPENLTLKMWAFMG